MDSNPEILINSHLEVLTPYVPVWIEVLPWNPSLLCRVFCEGKVVPCNVQDARLLTWTPQLEGAYCVEVKLNGKHIVRSPLILRCQSQHGVWGWGEGILSLTTGSPSLIPTFGALGGSGHTVVDVSASSQHCLVLTSTGAVWSMGFIGELGELGLGHNDPTPSLVRVPLAGAQIVAIATREGASMVVDNQGQVYCAGLQLAAGGHSNTFITPPGLETVRAVATSAMFVGDRALCLQAVTGRVFEFGSFGRKRNIMRARISPQFERATPVRLLRASLAHRFAIDAEGKLWYAMGEQDKYAELVPVEAEFARKENKLTSIPVSQTMFKDVIDIRLSRGSACFLTDKGKVLERVIDPRIRFADWRPSSYGFLWREARFPSTLQGTIVEMSSGATHFLFLDSAGQVFGMGRTEASQLGVMGGVEGDPIPIARCPRVGCVLFFLAPPLTPFFFPQGNRIRSTGHSNVLVIGVAQSLLGESMLKLWMDQQFIDCYIVSGDDQVPVHGVILAARIPGLSLFHSKLVCKTLVSKEILLLFVEFLYTDRLGACPFELKAPLNALALEWGLKRLAFMTSSETVDIALLEESTLVADLGNVVNDKRFSDFCIIVRDDDADREERIACHRCLLSRSDYFQHLFSSNMGEAQSGTLTMHSNINGIVKSIEYIYCESCADFDGDDCVDVLIASNMLLLPRLKELMEVEIQKGIDETNVGFIYECGVMANSSTICSCCLDFALHNKEKCQAAGGFVALSAQNRGHFFLDK